MLFLDKASALDLIVWNSHRARLPGAYTLALEPPLPAEPQDEAVPFWQALPNTAVPSAAHSTETPSERTLDARPLSLWRR